MKKVKFALDAIACLRGIDKKDMKIYPVKVSGLIVTVHVIGTHQSYEGEILTPGIIHNQNTHVPAFVCLKLLNGETIYIPSDKALIKCENKLYWQVKVKGEIKLHFYFSKCELILDENSDVDEELLNNIVYPYPVD